MAVVGVSYQMDHWIVITEINSQYISYLDPSWGTVRELRKDFVKDWKQVVIEIDKGRQSRLVKR